jgi:hypothetical protein
MKLLQIKNLKVLILKTIIYLINIFNFKYDRKGVNYILFTN